MTVRRIPSSYHSSLTKRSFDLAFSLISTIMLSPLLILILLAVKVTSPGPAFFIQKRIGKNGNVFKLIKFRTMKTGSEKLQGRYIKFNEWMKLDEDYVKNASFLTDLTILAKTVLIMLKQTARQTFNLLNFQNFS